MVGNWSPPGSAETRAQRVRRESCCILYHVDHLSALLLQVVVFLLSAGGHVDGSRG